MLINLSAQRRAGPEDVPELLGACHERIRRFVALARRAGARRDAPAREVAQACADVERYFRVALPLHVADEEESIAPRLRGQSPEVDRALETMAHQHQDHEPKLEALLRATAKVRCEPRDEAARGELQAAADALKGAFEDHLRLEETVIFPAISQLLPDATRARILEEVRRRRRDDGSEEP